MSKESMPMMIEIIIKTLSHMFRTKNKIIFSVHYQMCYYLLNVVSRAPRFVYFLTALPNTQKVAECLSCPLHSHIQGANSQEA